MSDTNSAATAASSAFAQLTLQPALLENLTQTERAELDRLLLKVGENLMKKARTAGND